MQKPDPEEFDKILTVIMSFGGHPRGGGGVDVLPGGGRPVDPRGPLVAGLSSGRRDERIIEACEVMISQIQNEDVVATMKRALGEAKEIAAS